MTRAEIEKKFPHVMGNARYTDLEVLHSNAGYFIGRLCWVEEDGLPGYRDMGSRESVYFRTQEEAQQALDSGEFDVRECAENSYAYERGLPKPVTTLYTSQLRVPECPVCGETAILNKGGETTLACVDPFVGEDGKKHTHNPNTHIGYWVCPNKHEWSQAVGFECSCGWQGRPSTHRIVIVKGSEIEREAVEDGAS